MRAQERLHLARQLASEGRYAEALDEYIWFHDHALEEERALAAVRLSFALSYWAELAEVYPGARLALEATRDRKVSTLRAGAHDWTVFHELASINDYLKCPHQTYVMFRHLAATDAKFAARCFRVALPALLQAGDFTLAERFLTRPVSDLLAHVRLLNREVEKLRSAPPDGVPRLECEVHGYASDIKEFLAVLRGVGRLDDASRLETFAINAVAREDIRAMVAAALKPGARPWYETQIEPD